jgi:hypothetical protein
MKGYVVQYERQNGTTGYVYSDNENGEDIMQVYFAISEAEDVAQEMRDAYSYTGLKYSVTEVGKDWK